eukprot:g19283.t1
MPYYAVRPCTNCEGKWSDWGPCGYPKVGHRERRYKVTKRKGTHGEKCRGIKYEGKEFKAGTTGKIRSVELNDNEKDFASFDELCNKRCEAYWREWGACRGGKAMDTKGNSHRYRKYRVKRDATGKMPRCKHPDKHKEKGSCTNCVGTWGKWGPCGDGKPGDKDKIAKLGSVSGIIM